jgi:hypothetical protein
MSRKRQAKNKTLKMLGILHVPQQNATINVTTYAIYKWRKGDRQGTLVKSYLLEEVEDARKGLQTLREGTDPGKVAYYLLKLVSSVTTTRID